MIKNRRLKFTTYSTIMIIGLIVLLLLLNYFVSQLDEKHDLSMDMTAYRIYSLTSTTYDVLDRLEQDIFIYTTESAGIEDANVKEMLHNYSAGSNKIHVENLDIVKNPGAVEYYNEFLNSIVAAGSVIVTNSADTNDKNQRYRILGYDDLYTYNSQSKIYDEFNAENAVTGAIKYITTPNEQKIWLLKEHSSDNSAYNAIEEILEYENYQVGDLSLLNGQSPIEKDDIVVALALESDLTDTELNILNDFLDDGGKMILGIDPAINAATDLSNMLSLMGRYNVKMGEGLVRESDLSNVAVTTDSDYVYSFIIPKMHEHDITGEFIIADYKLLLGINVGRMILPEKINNPDLKISPILSTSQSSFIEPWSAYMDDKPNEGAEFGSYTVMAEIFDAQTGAKLIALTAPELFTNAESYSQNVYRNKDFLLKTAAYLADDENDFYISSKPLVNSPLMLETMQQAYVIIAIVCAVIPMLIFAVGIFIYIRRKNL